MSGNLDVYLKSTNYKIIKNNIDKSEKYMNGDYKNYTRKFWYIVEFDYKNVINLYKLHNDGSYYKNQLLPIITFQVWYDQIKMLDNNF